MNRLHMCTYGNTSTYYVLEDAAQFYVEGELSPISAKAGQLVFLPQGKAHAFRIESENWRTLIMVVAVGDHAIGLDTFLRLMATLRRA